MQIDPSVRAKLLHQLTIEDKRQRTNPYALAHYFGALQAVDTDVADGTPLRDALKQRFCGPMVNRLIKAAGMSLNG